MSEVLDELRGAWLQKEKPAFNRDTFFHDTYANWREVSKPPDRPPDFASGSYSKYWFTKSGVYRCSNHWGNVASCKWALDGDQVQGEIRTGYCTWGKFQDMASPFKSEKEAMYNDYAVMRSYNKDFNLKERIAWDNKLDKERIKQNEASNCTFLNDDLRKNIRIRNSMTEKEFAKYKLPEWQTTSF